MLRAVTAVVTALLLYSAAPIRARDRCDVHYRWQRKIDRLSLERHANAENDLNDV